MSSKSPVANVLPFSWTCKEWPADVFPHNGTAGRRLLRHHQDELMKAGAISRVGHIIVVLGAGYGRWLTSKIPAVADYKVPANAPEHADKRFGGGSAE